MSGWAVYDAIMVPLGMAFGIWLRWRIEKQRRKSPPPPTPTEKLCLCCGRIGTRQFRQMADGSWRCSSPNNCQHRTRARWRIGGDQ